GAECRNCNGIFALHATIRRRHRYNLLSAASQRAVLEYARTRAGGRHDAQAIREKNRVNGKTIDEIGSTRPARDEAQSDAAAQNAVPAHHTFANRAVDRTRKTSAHLGNLARAGANFRTNRTRKTTRRRMECAPGRGTPAHHGNLSRKCAKHIACGHRDGESALSTWQLFISIPARSSNTITPNLAALGLANRLTRAHQTDNRCIQFLSARLLSPKPLPRLRFWRVPSKLKSHCETQCCAI